MGGKAAKLRGPGNEIQWHATVRLGFDPSSFSPLTHFGTRKAALERVVNVIFKRGWQYRQDMSDAETRGGFPFEMHSARLSIQRPIPAWDEREARHTAAEFADFLYYRKRLIGDAERSAVIGARGPMPEGGFSAGEEDAGEARASAALASVVRNLGADGFGYANACEDFGSRSWVILDGSQVSPAGPVERLDFAAAMSELDEMDAAQAPRAPGP